jgi:pre-rRNA-processing protein TSR1
LDGILAKKRAIGGQDAPPFLTAIVSLSSSAGCEPEVLLGTLLTADETATATASSTEVAHLSVKRFKQRYSFIIPNRDSLFDILDALKVCDTVLFLWPSSISELDEDAESLLTSIKAQGLPTSLNVVARSISGKPTSKKHDESRKQLLRQIEKWSLEPRLFTSDSAGDGLLLLRQICATKRRPLLAQERRAHLLVEELECVTEDSSRTDNNSCTLKATGYVRGPSLSANGLVHIPGFGDFQMKQIDAAEDPHPLLLGKRESVQAMESETGTLEVADPSMQWPLDHVVEPDPMEGEQTWPTVEELESAQEKYQKVYRRVPKGTSEYQANWILPDDDTETEQNEGESDEAADHDSDDSDAEPDLVPMDADAEQDSSGSDGEDHDWNDDTEDSESVIISRSKDPSNYDKTIEKEEELEELKRFRQQRENELFPDEIDTPLDTAARVRFQRYRGLKSYRTSPWDPKENLPSEYARIFQFQNFRRTKKKVLTQLKDAEGVLNGWYVTIHIINVPVAVVEYFLYSSPADAPVTGCYRRRHPLTLIACLEHEQRVSSINMVLSRQTSTVSPKMTIRSKDKFLFQVGYRRYVASPIFSQHTTGSKHKFERFMPAETPTVATILAPIIYPPASVLVFSLKDERTLIATGSVLDINPNRIITKRVVLSGHPFKIHKKTTVVRYMFFNPGDIEWFKPIELRTKYGRRGHIKEALGTHGHMKCVFDQQLGSQDTVLLNLYKRVFPKWSYDPNWRWSERSDEEQASSANEAEQIMEV